ncbi:RHS repeat-associated core domain-containing protein [Tenacibaculum maritimum]|uniref:RHS repeat-associated core domain-containing protein n=3 Tax=Tenacibaculum maritimum TaxID=107401 RepID=UPI00388D0A0A
MGVALIHMNGRMYDAKLGHFLSPDNFIQEPFSTQSFNRFGYVWNNPLKFTDPSGEIFWSVVIGAVIGAYVGGVQANGSYNPFEWKGNASTLLGVLGGAIIGGISGGVGAYAAAKLAPLITTAGGFLGGAVSGFIGGAVGGTIYGGFMSQLPGGDGDFWGGAAKGFIMGAVGGTILGGVIGGIRSVFHGKGFWTGKDLASKATAKTISSLKAESVESLNNNKTTSTINNNIKTKSVDINKVKETFIKTTGVDGNTKFTIGDELVPVRHHTSTKAMKLIQKSGLINPARTQPYGVDVEVGPFLKPSQFNGGQFGKGSYIEFLVPKSQISPIPGYMGGTGNVGRIITNAASLNIYSSQSVKFVTWKWF